MFWFSFHFLIEAWLALALLDLAIRAMPNLTGEDPAGRLFLKALAWPIARPFGALLWAIRWAARKLGIRPLM